MYLKEALPLVKLLEAEPPRMGSQPRGWELVRARAVSFLSAIRIRGNRDCVEVRRGKQRGQGGIIQQVSSLSTLSLPFPYPMPKLGLVSRC